MLKPRDRKASDADRLLLDGLLDLSRSRFARALVMVLVAVLVGAALYASFLYQQMRSEECLPVTRISTTMQDIIDMRRRFAEYQSDPTPDAELVLTGDEVSYTIGDRPELQMFVELAGDRMRARIAIPRDFGCYNIDFTGVVRIDDGVAVVRPDALVVGEADLGWLLAGRAWVVRSENMPDDRSTRLLENTARLRIIGGEAHIRLVNRWDIW